MKLKFLQNISHYYNKKFSLHMHMFIIYVLNLNKINTTIHSNIRFMIIAYKQNLNFRIHCKNPKNNIIINTPPSSSIDSTTSPKVKTMEGKGVWGVFLGSQHFEGKRV